MRSGKSEELFKILIKKGYPKEFSEVICKELNSDFTASKMIGYLYNVKNPRVEDVVDEMYAIIDLRDRCKKKHEVEYYQAKINAIYNGDLDSDD